MNNFPIYIPSRGRSEYMITSKALTEMGINHYVIVENDQIKDYQRSIKNMCLSAEILELDNSYKQDYDLCDKFGLTKSTGPGPARNLAIDHSKDNGYSHHWVMDDNIVDFRMMSKQGRVKCITPLFFKAMEDFVLRYKNIAMAGPDYTMFAFSSIKQPPFVCNTRIYSCNFINNYTGFRWRGRYNEDTILSLDMLYAGWCTVQFNVFLQTKMGTQVLNGGNTEEFYHKEGRVHDGERYAEGGTDAKSFMLFQQFPEITKIVHRFGRTHHRVNYKIFKKNKLIKKDNIMYENYDFMIWNKNEK